MKKIFLYILVVLSFCLCIFSPFTAKAMNITSGVIIGSNVAFRKDANLNALVISKLNKGASIKILDTNVNAEWDKIQYGSKTGYVNRMYVSFDSSLSEYNYKYNGTVVNCKTNATVRSTPASNGTVLGSVKKGATVTVTQKDCASGWDQVQYNDTTGYIATNYLSLSAAVDNTQLSNLTVSGGSLSPAFCPSEYGYFVTASSSKVTVKANANSGVKVDINKTGKSSVTLNMASGSMKTLRIYLDGKITYSVYIAKNVITYGTWNIKRGDGNLLMQGRLIYDQHPDIMGIQEAYRNTKSSNITDNLASLKTLTMPYTYLAPTINSSGGGEYGIGMLSRYNMSNIKTYDLDSSGYEHRILFKAEVNINGKKVSLYNTHFTYEKAAIRLKQFSQVLSVMNADKNKYKILTGDFNAEADEFAIVADKYNVVINTSTQYLNDAGNTFHFYYMDNIIVTKNIKVINSRIIDANLSDHYPVFAYIVLK